MISPFTNVGITVKKSAECIQELDVVIAILKQYQINVFTDCKVEGKDLPIFSSPEEIDMLIVIGGDGSIIRAVRDLVDESTPIVTVNRGTVGFLAEISYDSLRSDLPQILEGKFRKEERKLLTVSVVTPLKETKKIHCLNEVVVAQGKIARLLDVTCSVNSEFVAKYHADGLIVASPTGSTAYNISAGGPIVHPALNAMILTPINPHSLSQKPIVIPGQSKVALTPHIKQSEFYDEEIYVTLDGQFTFPLDSDTQIEVTMTSMVTFLRFTQETFFNTLRKKLRWGERLE